MPAACAGPEFHVPPEFRNHLQGETEMINDLHPGKLFSLAGGYWQPCTLHAGVKLGIFTTLSASRKTARIIALDIDADERAVELLCNALTSMELLIKEDAHFRNAPLSEAFLVSNAPGYVGHIILHHHCIADGWTQLDQAVKTGRPVEKRSHGEEFERESFQMGMFNLAMAISPAISKSVDLSDRRLLLDLGGGPGTHAIHFCLANTALRATIYDRATTRPFAANIAERFGVSERINFEAGDFNTDPIPGKYDVAWLSQVLHSNSYDDCRKLIKKTVATLEPGGLILIHDFFLNNSKDGPLFPALFSLNMLLNNPGRAYSDREVRDMLTEAGVTAIKRLPFQGANDSAIIQGMVPR